MINELMINELMINEFMINDQWINDYVIGLTLVLQEAVDVSKRYFHDF